MSRFTGQGPTVCSSVVQTAFLENNMHEALINTS